MAALFCVCLITSNIFEARLWKVWSLPFQLTGGVVIFPVSYIINDCLTEVYGYRKARLVIWMGFTMSFFVALTGMAVCALPSPSDEAAFKLADNFNSIFSFVPRTMAGSLLAFLAGSTVNAWVMSRMKVSSEGKRFGVRAIVSSVAGELVDSLIFFPIVFLGILGTKTMISLMITQVFVKTLYEIVVLPLTSVIVKKVKKIEGEDTFDQNISYNPFKINDI